MCLIFWRSQAFTASLDAVLSLGGKTKSQQLNNDAFSLKYILKIMSDTTRADVGKIWLEGKKWPLNDLHLAPNVLK